MAGSGDLWVSSTDPRTSDPRRLAIRPPRPLWIALAAAVLILVACGLQFGMPIYRQQMAVREIERLGGSVLTSPRGPKWLRDLAGDERMKSFDIVDGADLGDIHATDANLEQLTALTGLEDLWLHDSQVTDAGLAHLPGFANLHSLSLGSPNVTDAGLKEIAKCRKLRSLGLHYCPEVTDAGMREIARAGNLSSLAFSGIRLTDDGLKELATLRHLSELEICRSKMVKVTEAGIADLRRALPKLKVRPGR
jgi:hypothetical protein